MILRPSSINLLVFLHFISRVVIKAQYRRCLVSRLDVVSYFLCFHALISEHTNERMNDLLSGQERLLALAIFFC